jgi:uncharacterized protein (TIGR02099 family)
MPLAERWRRLRAAYRLANLASHHVLGFVIKTVALAYFLFAILFLLLRYAILPNIDYYKNDIENLASRALGNKVSIARIYASWRGLAPNLFLGDVVLRDPQGRQLLALPSVSATLSWWSVVTFEARFQSLEIIRPELDMRRGVDGRISVAGIALGGPGKGGGADWALKQREIVVREGRLQWTDQLRAAPPLVLDNVNLVLLNHWNEHRFGLKATPPVNLGQPIDVRAAFAHPRFADRISNMALWKGELYADVRETDLAAWKPYVDYPFQISSGKGAVRAWLALDHGRMDGFTADVGLTDVSARLGKDLPPLDLASVSGRLSARETPAPELKLGTPAFGVYGHEVSLSDFAVQTRSGLVLPATTISETYTPARGNALPQLEVRARQLDLAILAQLATQLPLTAVQRNVLAEFRPRGKVEDVAVLWQGRYPVVAGYRIRARFSDFGVDPQPAREAQPKSASLPALPARPALPGVDHLSGSIDATQQGGSLVLASKDVVFQLPAWFEDPAMPFDRFDLQARWTLAAKDQLQLQVDAFEFAQGALKGSLKGKHTMTLGGAHGPGQIDVEGSVDGFAINRIGKFLPLQTPPDLHAWLVGALEDGSAEDVSIKLRGDLAHFPFRGDTAAARARGDFKVAGRIDNGRLNYVPSRLAADGKSPLWPQAEKIKGSFLFERARMEIKGDTARTGGVALSNVKAVVPDLGSPDSVLDIDGSAAGPTQEFLRYVVASPVLDWIGRITEDTRATGNAKLGLKLHIPLHHAIESKVQGSLQLLGNDIVFWPDLPVLQATVGKIEFYERGVNLNGVGANFLGGPLALTGGSQRDDSIVIKLAGNVTADGLRKQYPSAQMQPVVGKITGASKFSGTVLVKDHAATVTVDSTLAGLGSSLPAPAAKTEAEALPLHFVLSTIPTGDKQLLRDDIRIGLGSNINARYLRQKQGKGAWSVLHGGIGVNVPAPEPESGMTINASVKTLNVDHWLGLANAVAAGAEPARVRAEGEPAPADMAQYVVPDAIAARAAELVIGERKLDNVVVGASHQANTWQASIDSRQVAGHIAWNEGSGGQGLGKVTARLASLFIPESVANDVKDLLESSKSAASTIPALDIQAEHFELFNKKLGRLELQASNVPALAGREWRINKLALATDDGNLSGTGKWVTRDGRSSTSLNFALDINDAGKLLDRLGFPETLRRGKGKLSGDIMWSGLPYSLDIPSLSGQIELNVESGQFLKQDPGAAKLLGVLSLQALPRLLKLDFHDVFSEGLAFDAITANAVISKGVLRTDNLRMHGVAATVLMDGSADIANESTNLHVTVIPEFNLGTGPLVYAIAVNPVIGLSSLLAQWVLRAPVMKALTYEMQVTGPWKAPVITKLEGARATALPPAPTKAE